MYNVGLLFQTLIEMDRQDEQNQTLAEIHHKLPTAYFQFPHQSPEVNFELSKLSPQQNEARQERSSDNGETSGTRDDVDGTCPPGLVLCITIVNGFQSRGSPRICILTLLVIMQKRSSKYPNHVLHINKEK